jgi:hypothetical protein
MVMDKYNNIKIHEISNSIDNKIYIGSTCSPLSHRLYRHCSDSMDGKTSGLYKHIRHIGQFEFKINLLEEYSCDTEFKMHCREQ